MITLAHNEILHFDKSSPRTIQIIELSRNELLLFYLDSQTSLPFFYLWSEEHLEWNAKILQNQSNLARVIPSPPRIEAAFLGFDNKGDLLLFFNQYNEEDNWDLFLLESMNYGKTWSALRQISPDFQSWQVFSPPYVLQFGPLMGHLLLPIQDSITGGTLVLISENNAKTWAPSLFLNIDEEDLDNFDKIDIKLDPKEIQTMRIVDFPTGEIAMYQIRKNMEGLWRQISLDEGYTWQSLERIDISPPILSDLMDMLIDPTEVDNPKVFFIGLYQIDSSLRLGLWVLELEKTEFYLKWNSPELGTITMDWCQLLIDSQRNIHIFYQTGSNLHHYWDSIQKI